MNLKDSLVGKGRSKKLAKDTLTFFLGSFASKVITFFMLPLYTSVLTTEEYGVADTITTTVQLLYPILTLSIAEAVLRFTFEKERDKNEIFSVGVVFILGSTVLLLACRPIAVLFGSSLQEYWVFFILYYLFENISLTLSYYVRACGQTSLVAIIGVIGTIIVVTVNILCLLVLKMGLKGYLLALIANVFISSILYYVFSNSKPKYFHWNSGLVKQMLAYSIPMIPALVIWWINTSVDKYIIAIYLGVGARGLYSVAYKIPALLTTIATLFTNSWRLSAYSDSEPGFDSFFSKVYCYVDELCILCSAIFILASEVLAKILFSNEYFNSWVCIPFLLVSVIFTTQSGILASIMTRQKRTLMLLQSTSLGAIINIGLNLLLIPKFGIAMAAFTTYLSFLITWIIRLIQVRKMINLEINLKKTLINYGLVSLMAVLMTLQVTFLYMWTLILFSLIVAINLSDIKHLFTSLLNKFPHKTIK